MKTEYCKPVVVGLVGKNITEEEKSLYQKYPPFGFILFKRNIDNKDQLSQLITSLKMLIPHAEIFIDQEGGRVERIKPPISHESYPTALTLANSLNYKKAIYENYQNITKLLNSLQIRVNCAPVADILYKEAHDIIGDRSFGEDIEKLIECSSIAIKAIIDSCGRAIVKHVPGHGRAVQDSHEHLPLVTEDIKTLEKSDFYVFKKIFEESSKQIKIKALMAMTAHIIYPALDPDLPATLSPTVISYIRNELKFNSGIIVSDDICMKALEKFGTKAEIAKKAIEAGCDLLLYCITHSKDNLYYNPISSDSASKETQFLQEEVLSVMRALPDILIDSLKEDLLIL